MSLIYFYHNASYKVLQKMFYPILCVNKLCKFNIKNESYNTGEKTCAFFFLSKIFLRIWGCKASLLVTVKLRVISFKCKSGGLDVPFLWKTYSISGVSLSVQIICLYVSCYLSLPSVSIVKQLLLVVQKLLVGLCGELKVWTLREELN